jgi:serine/threonine protein kinase
MRGGDLHHYLLGFDEGRVSEDEARGLMHQILSGVSYAHTQHICHRDLKLENILLKNAPPQEIFLKIADFGLSDFYRPGAMCRTNCGSLSYLAPEVFLNVPAPGPPLDVWSLGEQLSSFAATLVKLMCIALLNTGIILFALLCGRLPFEGGDLRGAKRHREVCPEVGMNARLPGSSPRYGQRF